MVEFSVISIFEIQRYCLFVISNKNVKSCQIWFAFSLFFDIFNNLFNFGYSLFLRNIEVLDAFFNFFSIHWWSRNFKTSFQIVDGFTKLISLTDLSWSQKFIDNDLFDKFQFFLVFGKSLKSTFKKFVSSDEIDGFLLLNLRATCQLFDCNIILFQVKTNFLSEFHFILNFF